MKINTSVVQLPRPAVRYCIGSRYFFQQVATIVHTRADYDDVFDRKDYVVDTQLVERDGNIRVADKDAALGQPVLCYVGDTVRMDNRFILRYLVEIAVEMGKDEFMDELRSLEDELETLGVKLSSDIRKEYKIRFLLSKKGENDWGTLTSLLYSDISKVQFSVILSDKHRGVGYVVDALIMMFECLRERTGMTDGISVHVKVDCQKGGLPDPEEMERCFSEARQSSVVRFVAEA